jgi:N-acetylmuramoyl-L-alanine amidase
MKLLKYISLACVIGTTLYVQPKVQPAVLTQQTLGLYAEYKCMLVVLYHEARGESVQGQRLVASVVLNRVKSKHYPGDVCSVVKQRKQFSHVDRTFQKVSEQSLAALGKHGKAQVAKSSYEALYGSVELPEKYDGSTHYHNLSVKPYWSSSMKQQGKEGNHVFYK